MKINLTEKEARALSELLDEYRDQGEEQFGEFKDLSDRLYLIAYPEAAKLWPTEKLAELASLEADNE